MKEKKSEPVFQGIFEMMGKLVESGEIVPVVSRIYPMNRIREALDYVSHGEHVGKVVISHNEHEVIDCTEHCIEQLLKQKSLAEQLNSSSTQRTSQASFFTRKSSSPSGNTNAIAIVGISGQFPKANTLEAYWKNIREGVSCISEVPASRWQIERFYDENPQAPGKTYCKYMGILDAADEFDPLFFNISPAEAKAMDPQQRVFLQNAWHAMEDAGFSPTLVSGKNCGVFVGCGTNDYLRAIDLNDVNAQVLSGGSASILAARISYVLNLQGPCLSIDTACSSSLVAIAEACDSLVLGNCELALAGGVCVLPGSMMHVMTSKANMLSPEGKCFTFDQRADGFVPGEGVGVLILKRLEDAKRNGDRIHGVIRGWSVNQDGKTNGITAPNQHSQIRLEKEVYERFKINPEDITLIEAHGTATKLGDPIEIGALIQSFRAKTDKKTYCALGSVKSNIGHTLTAAGVAGVIKALLAISHKELPPTINFEQLNEHIHLDDSPFYVNTTLKTWDVSDSDKPRMAAVSSFGFSGTNAHLVLEEYRADKGAIAERIEAISQSPTPVMLVLSAKNKASLEEYARRVLSFVESRSDAGLPEDVVWLADLAYTLQVGRDAMEYRLGLVVHSMSQLKEKLQTWLTPEHDSIMDDFYTGQVKVNKETLAVFDVDEELQEAIAKWIQHGKYSKLLELWVKGLNFDWQSLYQHLSHDQQPKRISAPIYPFAKEHYWMESDSAQDGALLPDKSSHKLLQPLLEESGSELIKEIPLLTSEYEVFYRTEVSLPIGSTFSLDSKKKINSTDITQVVDVNQLPTFSLKEVKNGYKA